jgi:hypothetical protein
MKERRAVMAAGLFAALLTAAAIVLLAGQSPAAASALSRDARGWLAARRYLEARGGHVTLVDQGLETPAVGGVLVLAFPWQESGWDDPQAAIDRWLQGGGTIVFAYAGERFDRAESMVAEVLDLQWDEPRGRPPLNPVRWREFARQEWRLSPQGGGEGARPMRIPVPRRVPRMPAGATALASNGDRLPVAFRFTRWRGSVVVLPAAGFSNARIGEPGNADLLETLRQDLGDRWSFDEFHHGLRAPLTAAETGPQRILTLYLMQVLFVYALVVVAVIHRFGPAAGEPAVTTGSAAGVLVGLGVLHARLGHEREAARLLLERARELDPRLPLPVGEDAETSDLLALARRVGAAQSGKGKTA